MGLQGVVFEVRKRRVDAGSSVKLSRPWIIASTVESETVVRAPDRGAAFETDNWFRTFCVNDEQGIFLKMKKTQKMADEEIHALAIDYFVGAKTTTGGGHVILKCRNAGGEFHIAVQFDQVLPLIAALKVEARKQH